ncbi:hypothetical protein [Hugenholtzia roseola]|uniref:hypothetical protein n=1 Tax=Hugenholtzia roseola TaxID=1002 RepID=UPI00041120A6|nr:hypothetical protein [Hugenholtzia roseola]
MLIFRFDFAVFKKKRIFAVLSKSPFVSKQEYGGLLCITENQTLTDMGIVKMERKIRRRRITAKLRQAQIKRLNAKPDIKNVDIEAIKASFAAKSEN